jgi:hypothetical protein
MKKLKSIPKYLIIVLFALMVVISSCSDEENPVNQNDGPYQFDSARYEWRTDTLYNSLLGSLFGFDTSHVYMLGTHSLNIYNGENYSSHFFGDLYFNVIGGLDNSNIYIGGSYPNGDYRLMKWDGSTFTDIPVPSDTSQDYGLTAILVQSQNEIWLGTLGKIFFVDGTSFKVYKIDSASAISKFTFDNGVLLASGRRYLCPSNCDAETYVYKFENSSWTRVFSERILYTSPPFYPAGVGNMLFGIMEEGIFKFNIDLFVKIISSPPPYNLGTVVTGSNENNLLAYGYTSNYDQINNSRYTMNWNGSKWSKEFFESNGLFEMKLVGNNYYCIVPSCISCDRLLLRIGRAKKNF